MYLSPSYKLESFQSPLKHATSPLFATKAIHPAPEADRSLPFIKKLLTNTYRFSDTSIVKFFLRMYPIFFNHPVVDP